ncbi:MAG: hypothetical protein V7L29_35200 [Nostoc sp.]
MLVPGTPNLAQPSPIASMLRSHFSIGDVYDGLGRVFKLVVS